MRTAAKYCICFFLLLISSYSATAQQDKFAQGLSDFDQKNYAQSVQLLRPYAVQGNCLAQFVLGYCYQNGLSVQRNDSTARQWLAAASAQKNTRAMGSLAVNLFQAGSDLSEAYYWAMLAAEYDPIQRMTSARYVIKQYMKPEELQAAEIRLEAKKKQWQGVATCP